MKIEIVCKKCGQPLSFSPAELRGSYVLAVSQCLMCNNLESVIHHLQVMHQHIGDFIQDREKQLQQGDNHA